MGFVWLAAAEGVAKMRRDRERRLSEVCASEGELKCEQREVRKAEKEEVRGKGRKRESIEGQCEETCTEAAEKKRERERKKETHECDGQLSDPTLADKGRSRRRQCLSRRRKRPPRRRRLWWRRRRRCSATTQPVRQEEKSEGERTSL